jgi:hypothetical protein
LTNAADKEMPLDKYLLNSPKLEAVKSAYSQSIAKCMRAYGMTFEAPEPPGSSVARTDGPKTRVDGRFGYQSMTYAKKWGYHPPGGLPEPKQSDDSPDSDPGEWFALTGSRDIDEMSGPGGLLQNGSKVPSHGCVGAALMKITGSREGQIGDADISTNLKFETLVEAQKDPRTLRVFSRWSRCMREENYSYTTPLDASGDPRWAKSSMPTPEEKKVAVADQECRARHNVVGVWFSVDYEYQERAVAENRKELHSVKKQLDRQVHAAKKILAQSP